MRKKIVVRMLCLARAASMIGTMVPTSLYPVTAKAAEANQDMEASDQNEMQIAVQAGAGRWCSRMMDTGE